MCLTLCCVTCSLLRFDIQDSDPVRVVRDKLERASGEWLGTDEQWPDEGPPDRATVGIRFQRQPLTCRVFSTIPGSSAIGVDLLRMNLFRQRRRWRP